MQQLARALRSPTAMVLVALALRLGFMIHGRTYRFDSANDHFNFGSEEGRIARSLVSGEGFSSPYTTPTGPTADQPPVYPVLIAAVFKLFGIYSVTSAWVIEAMQCVQASLTCLTIFLIARRTFGQTTAVLAGWAWAFFYYSMWWATQLIWETSLSTLLFSLAFLSALRLGSSRRLSAWVHFGLLWGLIALTNTALVSFFPVSLAWIWYRQRRTGLQLTRFGGASLVAFSVCVIPWAIRNYVVLGHFITVRDDFGLALYLGNNERPAYWRFEEGHPGRDAVENLKCALEGETTYEREKLAGAVSFIKSHPRVFVWRTFSRIIFYWVGNLTWLEESHTAARFAAHALLSLLAFLGLRLAFGSRNDTAPVFALSLLLIPLTYYITIAGTPRYRHPVEPLMMVLGAYAVTSGFLVLRRKLAAPGGSPERPRGQPSSHRACLCAMDFRCCPTETT